jgi:hypothetical protein
MRQESAALLDARDSALRASASKQVHLDSSLAECNAARTRAREEIHELKLEILTLSSDFALMKSGKASATKLAEQAEQELLVVRSSLQEMEDKVKVVRLLILLFSFRVLFFFRILFLSFSSQVC